MATKPKKPATNAEKPRRGPGRPRRDDIDLDKALELIEAGHSTNQAAKILGVPFKTLSDHFEDEENSPGITAKHARARLKCVEARVESARTLIMSAEENLDFLKAKALAEHDRWVIQLIHPGYRPTSKHIVEEEGLSDAELDARIAAHLSKLGG